MAARTLLIVGSTLCGLAVILGAFAAHALKSRLSLEMRQVFEIGVRYQMYHGLGLMLIGAVSGQVAASWLRFSGLGLLVGTVIFSGSLYALALTEVRVLGAITPIGGLCLIGGWLALIVGIATGVSK